MVVIMHSPSSSQAWLILQDTISSCGTDKFQKNTEAITNEKFF